MKCNEVNFQVSAKYVNKNPNSRKVEKLENLERKSKFHFTISDEINRYKNIKCVFEHAN
jgi:hypothetical protein